MKKILLLHLVFFVVNSSAQKQITDSLLNALNSYAQQDTAKVNLLIGISSAYSKTDTTKCFQYADSAILLAKKINDQSKLAECYDNKAMKYVLNEKTQQAIIYKNLYLQQLLLLKHSNKIVECYNYLSWLYYATGQYVTGLKNAQEGLIIANRIPNKELAAASLNLTGINYNYMGNYTKAMKNYIDALNLYTQLGNKNKVAKMYGNIGQLYYNLKQYDEAIIYTNKCSKILEELKDTGWLAAAYNNLGGIYLNKADYNKCIQYNLAALKLNKRVNSQKGMGNNLMDLGAAYTRLKDYNQGYYYLSKAISIYERLGAKNNISTALGYLTELYLQAPDSIFEKLKIDPSHRFTKALGFQKRSISFARETKDLGNEAEQWKNLSTLYKKKKDYADALSAHEMYLLLYDSIANDKNKKEIFTSGMQYDFERKQDSIKTITDKQQALAIAEINRQKVIRNASVASGSVFILAAATGIFFYRRKKEAETKKKEAELKAEISNTEMKALRAQMNPHFIFNSLNSITDYIDKHQTHTASDFTAKFAKLMRMVLENSEHKEIPLADDLKALELYMQLERFRLNNKFDYIIKVDESIDTDNTLVPPLILQPFVENSIWHGIAKKEGHGNICIYIKQQENMISCVVEDDGIGISEKKIVDRENKSLGMRITSERIEVINKLKNTNASMHVLNKQKGVRAEVRLPLELSF